MYIILYKLSFLDNMKVKFIVNVVRSRWDSICKTVVKYWKNSFTNHYAKNNLKNIILGTIAKKYVGICVEESSVSGAENLQLRQVFQNPNLNI